MQQLQIQNGRIIDPANQLDQVADIFIVDDKIAAVGKEPPGFTADNIIDASNCLVLPGLVDLSARLREPGAEHKGTIASETRAAAAAGITTLCVPPDTDPVIDEAAVVELIHRQSSTAGKCRVVTLGALTHQLQGEFLAEIDTLKRAGCVGVSNARKKFKSTLVLRRALEYAASRSISVFIEPDEASLSLGGCAHDGPVATRLGLPSVPEAAETLAIAQILELVRDLDIHIHLGRLSCARSVQLIRQAQEEGFRVTADVAAHQLHLTDMDISSFNSQCHVLPPARSQLDRDALRQGLKQGIIQVLCSDHQPHEQDAKLAPFPSTEPGISALETLLPLSMKLVNENILSLNEVVTSLTIAPAQILKLQAGTLSPGWNADLCIYDPDMEWTLDAGEMISHGRNTPFNGWSFSGRVVHTLMNGRTVFRLEQS